MYGLTPGTLTLFQDSKKAVMKKVAGAGRLRHSLLTCAVPLAFDEEKGGKTGVNILNKEESSLWEGTGRQKVQGRGTSHQAGPLLCPPWRGEM